MTCPQATSTKKSVDLTAAILELLKNDPPSPSTSEEIAKCVGASKPTVERRLAQLKSAGELRIGAYSTARNGKRMPIFVVGDGDDACAVATSDDVLPVSQAVVRWAAGVKAAVQHHPLMLALYPEIRP
jgi:DNA-binding Lrp family transcriptional regulator